jgi:Zn-dependent M16 (insulinase) family peptidase
MKLKDTSRYYIDAHSVIVGGKPSSNLADKLEKDEIARIKAQVERLGPEGLKKAEAEVQEAKAEHDRPIPTDILNNFPVPDVNAISWITVQSLLESGRGPSLSQESNSALSEHIASDGQPLSFFVQYDHVQVCRFVFISRAT